MPTDSSPPAVWVNRTHPSPVSGSGRRSGRGTAATPTWAPPAVSRAAPTDPRPDWPAATTRPRSTSRETSSRLARRTRPAASPPPTAAGGAAADDGALGAPQVAVEPVGQRDPAGGQQRLQVVEVDGRRVVVLGR